MASFADRADYPAARQRRPPSAHSHEPGEDARLRGNDSTRPRAQKTSPCPSKRKEEAVDVRLSRHTQAVHEVAAGKLSVPSTTMSTGENSIAFRSSVGLVRLDLTFGLMSSGVARRLDLRLCPSCPVNYLTLQVRRVHHVEVTTRPVPTPAAARYLPTARPTPRRSSNARGLQTPLTPPCRLRA